MPANYTLETLPRPNDPAVHIVAVPPQTYGVFRYSGSTSPAATADARRELLRLLEGSGWGPTGEPVSWFYDPPWTLRSFGGMRLRLRLIVRRRTVEHGRSMLNYSWPQR